MWKCYCKTVDKVSINSSAIKRQLINDLAKFEANALLEGLMPNKLTDNGSSHLIGGKVPTELNLFDWAVEVAEERRNCLPRWTMTEQKRFC
jgi:cyclase